MRILFDSKKTEYKTPFGCLTPQEDCTLHIHIPCSVKTCAVSLLLNRENGEPFREERLTYLRTEGLYDVWQICFQIPKPGLYFYYFRITGHTGTFRLFKQGCDTNMEDGDMWQVSCIPESFTTPDWAKGACYYQIFPDRFFAAGEPDLSGKLKPYTLHQDWSEEVVWQPDELGRVLNNDFYGGNFRGIAEKMDYIASMGITVLYLNPIGKSFSSHRYDTGDYKTPDPMLGTLEDFRFMCDTAHSRGIRVILDGVYSHTGDNSLYFDKYGTFGGNGAYCNPDSPFRSWYTFYEYPNRYNAWWDFDTLPTLNKDDPAVQDHIIHSEDSVVAHWLEQGADGFRLDVVDELPDQFVAALKSRIRHLRPDSLLMGEVWEDASNKIAYGLRRRYFVDGELDSVMNYPYRTAVLRFLRKEDDGTGFADAVMTVAENYPKQVMDCCLNLLGSHDTPRILTALVDDFDGSREELAIRHLSPAQLTLAKKRLMAASFLQYMLPGCPCIYYGDEAGMEGAKDPFNRRTYPWGKEDPALLAHYKALGQLRKDLPALRTGSISFFHAGHHRVGFERTLGDTTYRIYVNLSDANWELPQGNTLFTNAPAGSQYLAPMEFCIREEE